MFTRELQALENIWNDVRFYLLVHENQIIFWFVVVFLIAVIVIGGICVRIPKHDNGKKEGSDWPLHNDIISLSYICDASQLVSSAVEMDT